MKRTDSEEFNNLLAADQGNHPIHQDEKGNFTPRSVAKLNQTWAKIRDTDDEEVKPWERILRVNKFMYD